MEATPDYDDLLEKYQRTVVIRLQGSFYNAYDDCAFVVGALMGYKVKKKSANSKFRCGFSSKALDKVKSVFEAERVNYIVFENKAMVACRDYGDDNKFEFYLKTFDKNSILYDSGDSQDEQVVQEIVPDGQRTITFNCPEKIADNLEAFIEECNSCFGPLGNNRDLVISWLISAGLKHKNDFLIGN